MVGIKSVTSVLLYVTNTHETAKFYQALGFFVDEETDEKVIVRLKEFEFHCFDKTKVFFKQDSNIEQKGIGVFFYIQTENIETYYETIVEKGLKPSSAPKEWEWGNKEFVIKDPDGYKLVFYEKIK